MMESLMARKDAANGQNKPNNRLYTTAARRTYPGKTHDKKVADTEKISYPEHIALHKDTGFQGDEPNVRKLYQPKKSLEKRN